MDKWQEGDDEAIQFELCVDYKVKIVSPYRVEPIEMSYTGGTVKGKVSMSPTGQKQFEKDAIEPAGVLFGNGGVSPVRDVGG